MYKDLSKIAQENARAGVSSLMYDLKDKQHRTAKLYSCNALMKQYENGYIVLQSYSTDVCVYIPQYNIIAVYDTYSNTTAQHIHKFAKYLDCYNFLWAGLKADNTFIECAGLIYGTYQEKHERVNISYHYGVSEVAKLFSLINWLIGQRWKD